MVYEQAKEFAAYCLGSRLAKLHNKSEFDFEIDSVTHGTEELIMFNDGFVAKVIIGFGSSKEKKHESFTYIVCYKFNEPFDFNYYIPNEQIDRTIFDILFFEGFMWDGNVPLTDRVDVWDETYEKKWGQTVISPNSNI